MKKINKKGEGDTLMNNVLGTALAIAATVIIIIWLWWTITDITKDTELEAAQSIADKIKARINALENGQSLNLTIQGFNQKDLNWYLLGWGKNQDGRPDKCFFESCICICGGTNAEACQNKGICRFFEVNEIEVGKPCLIEQNMYNEGLYEFTDQSGIQKIIAPNIDIPENLFVIQITKNQTFIQLLRYKQSYLRREVISDALLC
ncbi:MAG: hypothetical protein ABIH92_03865 [Nanoarchaeota archaeon]